MAKASTTAIIVGVLLILVGILSRVLTGTSSITALIPAFFGLPIAVLGWLAFAPQRTRWSTMVIAALSLLGIIGTYSVLIDLFAVIQGTSPSASTIARAIMFVLCAILLLVCIVSLTGSPQQSTDSS